MCKFKEGYKVFHIKWGWGYCYQVTEDCVQVYFHDSKKAIKEYEKDGRFEKTDAFPCLWTEKEANEKGYSSPKNSMGITLYRYTFMTYEGTIEQSRWTNEIWADYKGCYTKLLGTEEKEMEVLNEKINSRTS